MGPQGVSSLSADGRDNPKAAGANLSVGGVEEIRTREDSGEEKGERMINSPAQVVRTHSTGSSAASKRPIDSAIRQQRLPAWQPILTPNNVIPSLFVLALLFIPLGVMFMLFSEQVQEYSFDYTDCSTAPLNDFAPAPKNLGNVAFEWRRLSALPKSASAASPDFGVEYTPVNSLCEIRFKVTKEIDGPVFQYYRLQNYYQNQRLYVKSVEWAQLRGDKLSRSELSDCAPVVAPDETNEYPVYYPCGLIANSMFTDIFGPLIAENDAAVYSFPPRDITWSSDSNKYGATKYKLEDIRPPPSWLTNRRLVNEQGEYRAVPKLEEDERFQNWMKVAGLPTFRKTYGKHDESIPPGVYTVLISSTYEVQSYGARKALIISNTSWVGGKNPFLGWAYIVAGGVFLFLALAFLARHLMAPRRLGDVSYLSWNQDRLTPSH